MNSANKENDLLQLQQFSQQSHVAGWCANVWFNGLVNRYPFHFLVYSKHTIGKEWRKEKAKKNVKGVIITKIDTILSICLEQEDMNTYERLLSTLDDFIQQKENKSP